MDTATFNSLKYGNIITSPLGAKLMVQHTKTDAAGNTTAIGVMPAFVVGDAAGLTLLDNSYSRTLVEGAADGSIVLMGKTVPGK